MFFRKPGEQWGSHGAADWGQPVAFGRIHSHLHITGGSDAPAPTLDCPLPTRPCAIACAGQPAAGGLQEHAIQHVQGEGVHGGWEQSLQCPWQYLAGWKHRLNRELDPPPQERNRLNSFLVADNARFEGILNFLEQKVLVGKQSTGGEAGCDSRAHIWLDRVSVRKVPSPL